MYTKNYTIFYVYICTELLYKEDFLHTFILYIQGELSVMDMYIKNEHSSRGR